MGLEKWVWHIDAGVWQGGNPYSCQHNMHVMKNKQGMRVLSSGLVISPTSDKLVHPDPCHNYST